MADRTTELLQLTHRYRKPVSSMYKDRFLVSQEVRNSARQFIGETAEIHKQLTGIAGKLDSVQNAEKENSLFNSQNDRLQTILDSVDDDVKGIKRKLREIEAVESESPLANCIKEVLKIKLFQVTKQFKSALQTRTKFLHAQTLKKTQLSALNPALANTRTLPTFLEDSQESSYAAELQETRSSAQERVNSIEHVERQLAELAEIVIQMGRIVHDHEEMLIRIDWNTDAALQHLDSASQDVRQYHESVTSNKNLMVKVFLIFVVFFAFFVVFLV